MISTQSWFQNPNVAPLLCSLVCQEPNNPHPRFRPTMMLSNSLEDSSADGSRYIGTKTGSNGIVAPIVTAATSAGMRGLAGSWLAIVAAAANDAKTTNEPKNTYRYRMIYELNHEKFYPKLMNQVIMCVLDVPDLLRQRVLPRACIRVSDSRLRRCRKSCSFQAWNRFPWNWRELQTFGLD